MTYNFDDDPSPTLPTTVDAAGVDLVDGSPQGDLISESSEIRTVSISIQPPTGWTLVSVTWTSGGNGTYSVPSNPGEVSTHEFDYTVAQTGASYSSSGVFKIKKAGSGA